MKHDSGESPGIRLFQDPIRPVDRLYSFPLLPTAYGDPAMATGMFSMSMEKQVALPCNGGPKAISRFRPITTAIRSPILRSGDLQQAPGGSLRATTIKPLLPVPPSVSSGVR